MNNRLAGLRTIKERGARLAHEITESMTNVERPGIRRELRDYLRALEEYITEHPGVGVGFALSAGVVIGWLLKRK
jgi:ElaB/YqjD/DUF883 family membrane-anchored ribosome-binding protein